MKKHVIALLLSIVLAASSIGTAPVLATETTAAEAISAQQEDSVERQEEFSEEIEDAESGTDTEESTEEATTVGESAQMSEELGQNTEEYFKETDETTGVDENLGKQDDILDIGAITEGANVKEEEAEVTVNEVNSTADTIEAEKVNVIEEEIEIAEEKNALLEEEVDESGTCGDKATWKLTGGDRDLTLTISGSGGMYNFEENGDHASPWRLMKGRISRVVIEEGITGIGDYAFSNCGIITDIAIPDSVSRIGKGAFKECRNLTNLKIPYGVTSIEYETFDSCSNLTSIEIPNSVESIESYAFCSCQGLTSIVIPDSVKTIKTMAFAANGVTSITIPASVTCIEENAFWGGRHADVYTVKGCTADLYFRALDNGSSYIFTMHYSGNPTEDEIDSGTCGDEVFWTLTETEENITLTISGSGEMYDYEENASPWYLNKGRISRIVIEDGITSIGDYAFSNCGVQTIVAIPDSVAGIGKGAFKECGNLTSIVIPYGVTSIEPETFDSCRNLTNIVIPASVESIETLAFRYCSSLTSIVIPDSVTSIKTMAFAANGVTSITIPASVTSIEENAFWGGRHADVYTVKGCTADLFFRSLDNGSSYICTIHYSSDQAEQETYPAGVVDESGSCGNHATWTLTGTDRDLTLTISGSGEMYDYEENASPWYLNKGRISRIVIEDGITGIGDYAFSNCGVQTIVAIPDSVAGIGKGAFKECGNLTSIVIPYGVTSIEPETFDSCRNLTNIVIPASVESIETLAFRYCSSLTSIVIPDSVTSIKTMAFAANGVTSITIPASVTSIEENAFWGGRHADIYTTKGSTADLYFRFSDDGASNIFTMHYPCERIGHKFDEWIVTKEATCTEPGSRERACTACYEIEIEVIPATGHTWAKDYTIDKEPTETEPGSESIHCTVCDTIDETSIRVIPKLGFSVDADFVVEKPAFNYTGYPIEPGVTVTYNGDQLVNGKDYTVSYKNNTNIGTATVYVNGIGEYSGTEQLQFRIRLGNTPKLHFTNVASGLKVSWQKVSGATRYKVYRNGDLIFTTSALVITDKNVKYKGGTKFTYTVVATEKNTGDSELSKSDRYYRLMPVGIKSLTNPSAGKMTVTYDKSAGCYGYVIRYGLKSDMSDANVVTVQGENKTSRTFGGMKKGKKYYVQVRTYMLENGVRYYSAYCTTKTITIKK